jgi:hypothetical protein
MTVGTAIGVGAVTVAVDTASGAGCAATKRVGAAVDTGDAALHPTRSTTTAARPKPINRDTLREIKLHQPARAS